MPNKERIQICGIIDTFGTIIHADLYLLNYTLWIFIHSIILFFTSMCPVRAHGCTWICTCTWHMHMHMAHAHMDSPHNSSIPFKKRHILFTYIIQHFLIANVSITCCCYVYCDCMHTNTGNQITWLFDKWSIDITWIYRKWMNYSVYLFIKNANC